MTRILRKLNVDGYAGDRTWKPLIQWATERGEMGLYESGDTVMLVILVADDIDTRTYSSINFGSAQTTANIIAWFAGATIVKEAR